MESYYMPSDVMVEILLRLPIKSLMKFRCVSKYWRAFIKSAFFIRRHLLFGESTGIKDNRLILMSNVFCKRMDVNLLVSDENIDKLVSLELPFFMPCDYPHLFGSCNGILALALTTGQSESIILWNPAAREFKALPKPHVSPFNPSDPQQSYVPHLGFGFDSKTNGYKVVRILSPNNKIKEVTKSAGVIDVVITSSLPLLVEVYTLSSNSWKIKNLEVPFCGFLRVLNNTSTYLDGICYWWVTDPNGQWLLSFDMVDEVFQKIPLPDYCAYDFRNSWLLTVLKGSVALIVYCDGEGCKCFDVWLLTYKHGKNCSPWVKHSTIGPLYGNSALGYWLNGEFLMRSGCKVISYDPDAQVSKDAYVIDGYGYSIQLVLYKESLVALETEN